MLHFAVLQEELIKAGLAEVSKREQVRQEAKLSTQKGKIVSVSFLPAELIAL